MLSLTHLPLEFLLTAVLGTLLAGFVCSTSGVYVVRMNLSAIGFTMSHAAFAGAALAVWQGFEPLYGAMAFAMVTALVLGPVSERAGLKAEVMLGFLFTLLMALGFLFLSATGEAASGTAMSIIWGSIFSVDGYDVLALVALGVVFLLFTLGFLKEILATLFDRKLAEASGVNTRLFYYAVLFMTGVAVALSLKLVGGLLVYALIINPASTAYQFSSDMKRIIWASPVIGVLTSVGGFVLSLQLDLPVGSSIIVVSALTLAVAIAVSPKRRRSGWRGAIPKGSPH